VVIVLCKTIQLLKRWYGGHINSFCYLEEITFEVTYNLPKSQNSLYK